MLGSWSEIPRVLICAPPTSSQPPLAYMPCMDTLSRRDVSLSSIWVEKYRWSLRLNRCQWGALMHDHEWSSHLGDSMSPRKTLPLAALLPWLVRVPADSPRFVQKKYSLSRSLASLGVSEQTLRYLLTCRHGALWPSHFPPLQPFNNAFSSCHATDDFLADMLDKSFEGLLAFCTSSLRIQQLSQWVTLVPLCKLTISTRTAEKQQTLPWKKGWTMIYHV
jgi:hypothetical protein